MWSIWKARMVCFKELTWRQICLTWPRKYLCRKFVIQAMYCIKLSTICCHRFPTWLNQYGGCLLRSPSSIVGGFLGRTCLKYHTLAVSLPAVGVYFWICICICICNCVCICILICVSISVFRVQTQGVSADSLPASTLNVCFCHSHTLTHHSFKIFTFKLVLIKRGDHTAHMWGWVGGSVKQIQDPIV